MARTSAVADSQCVHAMVAEDILKFAAGLFVYALLAFDAFFNMTGENKYPAVLAWLVLIPICLYVLTLIVSLHAEAISKKYNLNNAIVAGLQYMLGSIYLLVFTSMCAALRFAIPKGHLLVWSSFFVLPVCGMLFAVAVDTRVRGW